MGHWPRVELSPVFSMRRAIGLLLNHSGKGLPSWTAAHRSLDAAAATKAAGGAHSFSDFVRSTVQQSVRHVWQPLLSEGASTSYSVPPKAYLHAFASSSGSGTSRGSLAGARKQTLWAAAHSGKPTGIPTSAPHHSCFRQFSQQASGPSKKRSVADTGLYVTAMAVGMLGLSYASVPLYRMYCQATGYGGTAQTGKVSQCIQTRSQTFAVPVKFPNMSFITWKNIPQGVLVHALHICVEVWVYVLHDIACKTHH